MKPVGEPDAGNPHVRFDERGWETERCRMAQATAPILDSTIPAVSICGVMSAAGGSRHSSSNGTGAFRLLSAFFVAELCLLAQPIQFGTGPGVEDARDLRKAPLGQKSGLD